MRARTDPLLPTIRIILVVLAAISGFLVGISLHLVYDPGANAIGFFIVGLLLQMMVEGWARLSHITGLGCLVGAVWVVIIVVVAAL